MTFMDLVGLVTRWVFGREALAVFLLVGLYMSWRTGFVQFTRFGVVLRETLGAVRERALGFGGEITPFQATMVAMGATVGVGNILGVTVAILAGGPGAVVWMWIAALVGMATKFAEATLAVHYRRQFTDGSVSGGPFYYIARGLGLPWLGGIVAVFVALAAFGAGNLAQTSAVAGSLEQAFDVPTAITSLSVAVIVAVVLGGGIRRVARFAQAAIPLMILLYIVLALGVILLNADALPQVLAQIFQGALGVEAAAGGVGGYALMQVVQAGVGRGIFSNEAGLGSAAIAHAQAQVDHPVRQGFWGVVEVFLDTIVINTLTALAVLSAGVWRDGQGASAVAVQTFATFPTGDVLFALAVALFAFTTIVSWGFYGEEAASFLFGDGIRWPSRLTFITIAFVGGLGGFEAFLAVSDMLIGLMAIPNLIGLVVMGGLVSRLVRGFFHGEPWVPPRDE